MDMRLHREGFKFGTLFLLISFILWYLYVPFGILGSVLTLWCFYFFRNPLRTTPLSEHLIVAPADGKIISIQKVRAPRELGLEKEPRTRISIFMNVFNVHVNRVPMSGIISKVHYHKGKFFPASLDKASEHNERKLFTVESPKGLKIGFVQIAGLIARRIQSDVVEGDQVQMGQIFGIIRFGSRMDIYLPPESRAAVLEGQTTIAGETILATIDKSLGITQGVTQ